MNVDNRQGNAAMTPPTRSYLSAVDRRRLEENLKKLNTRKTPLPNQQGSSTASQTTIKSSINVQTVSDRVPFKTAAKSSSQAFTSTLSPSAPSFRIPKRTTTPTAPTQSKGSATTKPFIEPFRKQNGHAAGAGPRKTAEPSNTTGKVASFSTSAPLPSRLSIVEALKAGQMQRSPPKPLSLTAVKNNKAVSSRSDAAARSDKPGVGITKSPVVSAKNLSAVSSVSSTPMIAKSFDDILKIQRAIGKPIIKQKPRKAVAASAASAKPVSASAKSGVPPRWSPAAIKKPSGGSSADKPSVAGRLANAAATSTTTAAASASQSAARLAGNGKNANSSNSNIPGARKVTTTITAASSNAAAAASTALEAKLAAMEAEMAELRKQLSNGGAKSLSPKNGEKSAADSKAPGNVSGNSRTGAVDRTRNTPLSSSVRPKNGNAAAAAASSASAPSPTTGFIMPNVKRKPPIMSAMVDSNTISPAALKRSVHMMAHNAAYHPDYDEYDEYDDDLADFVVDDDEVGEMDDAQAELDKMFSGYRKRARKDQGMLGGDDRAMESSWTQQQAEEQRSKRIGAIEDYNEARLEKAQEKAKKLEKERKELKKKLKEMEEKNKKKHKKKKNKIDDDDDD